MSIPPVVSAISSPHLRVLTSLRRIIRAADLYSKQLAASHKITAPQLIAILTINGTGDITTGELSAQIHLSPSTVIGILDRLEAKGLVQRQRDAEDRRLVRVTLTEAGKSLAARAPSPLQETLARSLALLPAVEQENLARSLEQIVVLMEVGHLDAAPMLATGSLDAPAAANPSLEEKPCP